MISIAMTTYNGEKYLAEQIDSILTQTISSFELIICDDCSIDSTRKILSEYAKKDSRIKIIFNEQNLGFVKNFEKAISFCKGEYIAFSDQDDIWLPNHLEVLLSDIQKYDCAIVCANSAFIDKDGKDLHKTFSDSLDLYSFNKETIIYRVLCYCNVFAGHDMMGKTEKIKSYLPIPENCTSHDFWFAICAITNSNINFNFETITNYRIHENNTTNPKTHDDKKQKLTTKLHNTKNHSVNQVNRFFAYDSLKQRALFKDIQIEQKFLLSLDYLRPFYYGKNKVKALYSFCKIQKFIFPENFSKTTRLKKLIKILLS